jgi:hypothetical protein
MTAGMSEKSSLTLHRAVNFKWGKRLNTECWTRKEESETEWLHCVWKLKGIKKKADIQRHPLCLYEGDIKYDWTVQKLEIGEQNF